MPWEENTFSSMKKKEQPDSVNNKIMIVSLGDYAGPKKKKKSQWNTSLHGKETAIKLWKSSVNKIKSK